VEVKKTVLLFFVLLITFSSLLAAPLTGTAQRRIATENQAPIINAPSELSFDEDTVLTFDFSPYISDPDGDSVSLEINERPNIQTSVTGHTITFTPDANWNGTHTFVLTVFDGILPATQELHVTVNPINDAPVFNCPSTVSFDEDNQLVVDMSRYITNVDQDTLTIVVNGQDSIHASVEGLVVTLSAPLNWNGAEDLQVTLSDGINSETQPLHVVVNAINDAPILNPPSTLSFIENGSTALDLSPYLQDVDSEHLTIRAAGNEQIQVAIDSLTVTFSNSTSWNGEESISLVAVDEQGAESIPATIAVSIIPVNDAPVFDLPEQFSFDEDSTLTVDFRPYVTDIDNDTFDVFYANNGPINVSIQHTLVTFSAPENYTGQKRIVFTVSDNTSRAIATDYVDVIVNAVNDAPAIRLPENWSVSEDNTLQIDFSSFVSDTEESPLRVQQEASEYVTTTFDGLVGEIRPNANWNGSTTLTYTVSDGELTASTQITLQVLPVNDAPVLTVPENVTFAEDSTLTTDVTTFVSDIDSDSLTYSVQGSNNVIATMVGSELHLSATADWNGNESIALTVSDGELTDTKLLPIVVTAVNDAPVINGPASISFEEDGTNQTDFSAFVTDIDSKLLSLEATNSEHITASVNNMILTLTSAADWNGTEDISVTVSDGEYAPSVVIPVTVTAVNDAPVLSLPANFTFAEDESLTVDLSPYLSDVDNVVTDLQISLSGNENVHASITGQSVQFTATANYHGTETLTFSVSDEASRLLTTANVDIIVTPVNDEPTLSLPTDFSMNEDDSLTIDLGNYAADIDGDALTLTVEPVLVRIMTPRNHLQAQVNNLVATIRATENWYGNESLRFIISDGASSVQATASITVNPVNDAPVPLLPANFSFAEDDSITIDLSPYVSDIESDPITITVNNTTHIIASVTGSALHLASGLADWNGTENIDLVISDGVATVEATVPVNVTPVNDAPIANFPANISFAANTSITKNFAQFVSDIDSNELTLSILGQTNVITSINGMDVTFQPAVDWLGTENLTFTVSDGSLTASSTVAITTTDSLTFNPPAQFSFAEDEDLQEDFASYIGNIDHSPMMLSITGNTDIHYEQNGLLVRFYADANWNGAETLSFTATDSLTNESLTVSIPVTVTAVNDAPTLALPNQLSGSEDTELTVDLSSYAQDIESSTLAWSSLGTEHLQISFNGATASISPTADWSGVENLIISVSDGSLSAVDTVEVTINAVDDLPLLSLPAELTFNEDDSLGVDFAQYVTDVDTPLSDLHLSFENRGELLIAQTDYQATFQAPENWNGAETITVNLLDNLNAVLVSSTLPVNVTPVNDAPVIELPLEFTMTEDIAYIVDLSSYVSDVDNSNLSISSNGNANLNVIFDGLVATIQPVANYNGVSTLAFTVSDGALQASDSISVNVLAENDPPTFVMENPIHMDEDASLSVSLAPYLSDDSTPISDLIVNVESGEHLTVVMDNQSVTLTPAANWNGTEQLTVSITEPFRSNPRVSGYSMTVIVDPVNDAPELNMPINYNFLEDGNVVIDFRPYSSDVDGDSLILSVVETPARVAHTTSHLHADIQGLMATVSADANWYGMEDLTFRLSDGSEFVTQSLSFSIAPDNDAPVISLPANITFAEDSNSSLDLRTCISDVDNETAELHISVEQGRHIIASLEGDVLSLSAPANWNGQDSVRVTVTDESTRATTSADLVVIVTPVNDAPTLAMPVQYFMNEDESLDLDFAPYVADVDGDALTIALVNGSGRPVTSTTHLHASINGLVATISTDANWNGIESLTFSVSDGLESAQETYSFVVNPMNDAPELNLPAALTFNEDSSLSQDFHAYLSDIDGDSLLISVADAAHIHATVSGHTVNFTATADWNGVEVVTVTLDDGATTVSSPLSMIVTPVNDAPTMDLPTTLTTAEDTSLSVDFSPYIQDIDSYNLRLVASNNTHIQVNTMGLNVMFVPDSNWFGEETIQFTVTDGVARAIAQDQIIVTVTSVNDAPVIALPATYSFDEDTVLELNLASLISDVDNTEITLTSQGSEHIRIEQGDFDVRLIPTPDWNGVEAISFTVSDGKQSTTAHVDVTVNPVNDAPLFDIPASFSLNEDSSLSVDFSQYMSDVDNTTLSLMLTRSRNLLVSIENHTVTFTPAANWHGSEIVHFNVTDEVTRAVVTDETEVTVLPVNDAPVITLPSNFTVLENGSANVDFANYVSDVDNDNLVVSASGNTSISINFTGLVAHITAPANWNGSENVTFTVSDGTLTAQAQVPVIFSSVNNEPIVNIPTTFTFAEDGSLDIDLSLYVSDVDNNVLTIEALGTQHTHIVINGLMAHVTADADWNGEEAISFSVSDGVATVSGPTNIIVTPVNDTPIINLPPSFSFDEDNSLTVDLAANIHDVDSPNVILTVTGQQYVSAEVTGLSVHFTTAANWNGSETLTFTVNDNVARSTAYTIAQVIVNPVNDAPVVALPTHLTTEEDTALNLDLASYISDPDVDPLTVFATNSSHISVSMNGLVARMVPTQNWNGEESILFAVTDGITSTPASVLVTVTPVNDTPAINLPASYTFNEDEMLTVDFSTLVSDVDSQNLSLSVSGQTHISATLNGLSVLFAAEPNWNGAEVLTFTVNDNTNRAIATANTQVIVTPVNDAPAINLPASYTMDEDGSLDINFTTLVSDIDSASLTIAAANSAHLTVAINGLVAHITPAANWSGMEALQFMVNDGVETASASTDIIVNPVNDTPTIDLPSSFTFAEDTTLSVDMTPYISDIDSQNFTLSVTNGSHISASINGLSVLFNATANWNGNEQLTFAVNDGANRTIATAQALVIVTPVNDAPAISLPTTFAFDEDGSIDIPFTTYISDIDNTSLTVSATNSTHLNVVMNGLTAHVTPTTNWFGTESITFTVSDGELTAEAQTAVTVNPINDAPTISLPASYSFAEDGSLVVDMSSFINDVDSPNLTLSVSGQNHITTSVVGLTVTFGTAPNWNGSETLTFAVSDNIARASRVTTTTTAQIIVTPVNDAPTMNLPANFTFEEDGNLQINMANYISDVDNTTLSISVSGNTNIHASINDLHVTLSANANWNGTENLTFTVSDGVSRAIATSDAAVIVTPVNDAPVINLPTPFTFAEDSSLDINIAPYISDIDNSNLSVTAQGSTHLTVVMTGNVAHVSASTNWNGTENIQFTVSDGTLSNTAQTSIIVTPVNDAPAINLPASFSFAEDGSLTVDMAPYISDVDNSGLTLFVAGGVNVISSITGTSITFTAAANWNGSENLTFSVSDGISRLITSTTANVIVTPVNDTPVINAFTPIAANLTVQVGNSQLFTVNASDIDSQLQYTWFVNNVNQNIGIAQFTKLFDISGEFTVKVIVSDGSLNVEKTWTVTVPLSNDSPEQVPLVTNLYQNVPNPFNPVTNIRYSLKDAGQVAVTIYNAKGQLIKTLVNENKKAGNYTINWDGTDMNHGHVSSGLYLIRLQTNDKVITRKATMLK